MVSRFSLFIYTVKGTRKVGGLQNILCAARHSPCTAVRSGKGSVPSQSVSAWWKVKVSDGKRKRYRNKPDKMEKPLSQNIDTAISLIRRRKLTSTAYNVRQPADGNIRS